MLFSAGRTVVGGRRRLQLVGVVLGGNGEGSCGVCNGTEEGGRSGSKGVV